MGKEESGHLAVFLSREGHARDKLIDTEWTEAGSH
jgi:hypothetical protein